jgi:hypothetical protein
MTTIPDVSTREGLDLVLEAARRRARSGSAGARSVKRLLIEDTRADIHRYQLRLSDDVRRSARHGRPPVSGNI